MNGRRGIHRTAGLFLALVLVLAQGLQAAALRDCPHHGGVEHAATPGHRMPAGSMHESPAGPDEAPEHAPCDCLGPCGAAAVAAVPPAGADSPFEPVAGERIVAVPSDAESRSLRTTPFALPYPNAPPVPRS